MKAKHSREPPIQVVAIAKYAYKTSGCEAVLVPGGQVINAAGLLPCGEDDV